MWINGRWRQSPGNFLLIPERGDLEDSQLADANDVGAQYRYQTSAFSRVDMDAFPIERDGNGILRALHASRVTLIRHGYRSLPDVTGEHCVDDDAAAAEGS